MFIRFELESFLHFYTYKLIFHFDSFFDGPYDIQKLKFFIMFTVSANWASKFSQMSSSSSSIGCISSNSFKSENQVLTVAHTDPSCHPFCGGHIMKSDMVHPNILYVASMHAKFKKNLWTQSQGITWSNFFENFFHAN